MKKISWLLFAGLLLIGWLIVTPGQAAIAPGVCNPVYHNKPLVVWPTINQLCTPYANGTLYYGQDKNKYLWTAHEDGLRWTCPNQPNCFGLAPDFELTYDNGFNLIGNIDKSAVSRVEIRELGAITPGVNITTSGKLAATLSASRINKYNWGLNGFANKYADKSAFAPGTHYLTAVVYTNRKNALGQQAIILSNSVNVAVSAPVRENRKNPAKYFSRQVFMITDDNWQTILPLVPLTIWTDAQNKINKYPTLIYRDQGGYDVDGAINFLRLYQPNHITLIDHTDTDKETIGQYLVAAEPLGANVKDDGKTIDNISSNDYLNYWADYRDVVYVANDYQTALVAAAYASLINAPLVIANSALDKPDTFANRQVICAGNVSQNCATRYSLEQLQDQYANRIKTLTNAWPSKIIMTNPNDWSYHLDSTRASSQTALFETLVSGQALTSYFGKHSLAAPFLAAAKYQYILLANDPIGSTAANPYDGIVSVNNRQFERSNRGSDCNDPGNQFRCWYWRDRLAEKIKQFNWTKSRTNLETSEKIYQGALTILADGQAIPYAVSNKQTNNNGDFIGADKTVYANLDNANGPEVPFGRIAGYTSTDVSGYVARAIFFDDIKAKNAFSFITTKVNGSTTGLLFAKKACSIFSASGWSQKTCTIREDLDNYVKAYEPTAYDSAVKNETEKWRNVDFIHYRDHGSAVFAGLWESYLPLMSNTFVDTMACSTAEISHNVNYENNIALMAMRRGAIAYLGAVTATYEYYTDMDMANAVYYLKQPTLGEAYVMTASKYSYETLLGDPTLTIVNGKNSYKGINSPLVSQY